MIPLSDKFLGGTIVLGEVVRFHVLDSMVNNILEVDADQLNAIGRMGGPVYSRTKDRFEMIRPA